MKVPHGIVEWRLKIESAERRTQRAERERIKRYAPCAMLYAGAAEHCFFTFGLRHDGQSTINGQQ